MLRFRLQEVLDSRRPPMSQSELARRTGLVLATVNRICGNVFRSVNLDILETIARELDVTPATLLHYEPDPKSPPPSPARANGRARPAVPARR